MFRARRRVFAVAIALVTALPILVTAAPAAAAETADCKAFSSDLYQLVKPTTGASLLTSSTTEADAATARYGFTEDKGTIGKVASRPGNGLVAVWRLYKWGDFVWATDGPDANAFVADGYSKQFISFYAGNAGSDCVSPIQRLSKDGMHRMAPTSSVADLEEGGWTVDDSAVFYATTGEEVQTPPAPAPPADTDTSFSIAVLPDTQNESGATATRFANRVSWLVANQSALDIRYMLQVGDLVNWGNVEPTQFAKLSTELKPLEATMHWAGAIGNHDTAAVCARGSACPGANTNVTVRDTSAYNKYFPVSRFSDVEGTFEANKIDNAYRSFSAGGVDWLVLNLELWPRKDVVTWAKSVVDSHPDENVIVVTHSYLEANGSISQSNGGYGATSPQYLYDNLIKVSPNVRFVFSGHVGNSAIRTDTGTNGNKIVSILTAYHSTTNPTRILTIDTAKGTANSTVFAPGTNTSYPADATSTSGLSFVK